MRGYVVVWLYGCVVVWLWLCGVVVVVGACRLLLWSLVVRNLQYSIRVYARRSARGAHARTCTCACTYVRMRMHVCVV